MDMPSTLPEETAAAYRIKDHRYYAGARRAFVAQLPIDPAASVLEIGCGTGATGAFALAEGRCGRYVGVELMPGPAAEARKVLTQVIEGDAERLPLDFPEGAFDALILSEVLEHLREPEALLKRLAPLLRPGGLVLAGSPNVSHWRVLAQLARGQFPQDDSGVFDRTHLRWFTPRTFAEMFERAGFTVLDVSPVCQPSFRTRVLMRATGGMLAHLFMTQIALKAVRR